MEYVYDANAMVPEREIISPIPLPLHICSTSSVTSQGSSLCITVLLNHFNRIQNIIQDMKRRALLHFNKQAEMKTTPEAKA